jgi:hypothetical protein
VAGSAEWPHPEPEIYVGLGSAVFDRAADC